VLQLVPRLPRQPRLPLKGRVAAGVLALSSYSIDFSTIADESPLVVGGNFTSTDSALTRMRVVGGVAVAAPIAMVNYEDSYALKTGTWSDDQEAEGIIYRASGYNPPANHEVELLLRGTETTGDSRSWYEFLWNDQGGFSIVYLTGPSENYVEISTVFNNSLVPADGMRMVARAIGTTLSIWVNANDGNGLVERVRATGETRIAGGRPGLAGFYRAGATAANYGWKSYICRSLT
jgi:hypothetical protein